MPKSEKMAANVAPMPRYARYPRIPSAIRITASRYASREAIADHAATCVARAAPASRRARGSSPVSCPTRAMRLDVARERVARLSSASGRGVPALSWATTFMTRRWEPPRNWSANAATAGASGMPRSAAIARIDSSASCRVVRRRAMTNPDVISIAIPPRIATTINRYPSMTPSQQPIATRTIRNIMWLSRHGSLRIGSAACDSRSSSFAPFPTSSLPAGRPEPSPTSDSSQVPGKGMAASALSRVPAADGCRRAREPPPRGKRHRSTGASGPTLSSRNSPGLDRGQAGGLDARFGHQYIPLRR